MPPRGYRLRARLAEIHTFRVALVTARWRISRAAAALDVPISTVRRAIARDSKLEAEYVRRSPGPGRPSRAIEKLE